MQLNSHSLVTFLKGRWPATESSWMTVNHSLAVSRLSPTSVAGQPDLPGTGKSSWGHKQSSLGIEKSRGQERATKGSWELLLPLPKGGCSVGRKRSSPQPLSGLRASDLNSHPEASQDIFQSLCRQEISGTADNPERSCHRQLETVEDSLEGKASLPQFVTWGFSNIWIWFIRIV